MSPYRPPVAEQAWRDLRVRTERPEPPQERAFRHEVWRTRER